MSKKEQRINSITSDIQEFMLEWEPSSPERKQDMLGYFSNIICQFDTDIAIEVMEGFGKEGKEQAMAIKVNYGY